MLKIRLLSDLHLEFGPFTYADMGEDVVVLAGDIHTGIRAVDWAQEIALDFPEKDVIFVPGNHEYYHERMDVLDVEMNDTIDTPNLHLLQNSVCEVKGYTFLGGTMWSGFNDGDPLSMLQCRNGMNDFQLIYHFTPEKAYELSSKFRAFYTQEMPNYDSKRTVVVTHHLPTMKSVNPRYLQTDYVASLMVGSSMTWSRRFGKHNLFYGYMVIHMILATTS
jgi:predicted phosphohydrolase